VIHGCDLLIPARFVLGCTARLNRRQRPVPHQSAHLGICPVSCAYGPRRQLAVSPGKLNILLWREAGSIADDQGLQVEPRIDRFVSIRPGCMTLA
jgi:hypothetical protein